MPGPAHSSTPTGPVYVVGDLPGSRQEWIFATARVSGVLLTLRSGETGRRIALPDPLAGGRTLRAWARIVRPVLDRAAGATVVVPVAELDVVADAAAALGRTLCRSSQRHIADDPVLRLLECEADVLGSTPGSLVAQLARVHGVLTTGCSETARALWRAGA